MSGMPEPAGSPSRTPVCAGLTTATDLPAALARPAMAAVTMVLPTPVPVPVMMRTPLGPGPAMGSGSVMGSITGGRGSPQPGDELVAVAPVPGLRPLHRLAGGVDRVPG